MHRAQIARRLVLSLLLVLPGLASCEKGQSNVPLIQEADAPFGEEAGARARRDGRDLRWRDHAIHIAVERGLPRARAAPGTILLPIAEVDKGYNSAQVTFYRWLGRDIKADGKLYPDRASRWLNIPILLSPDRILENEQHADYVVENSPRAHEIQAVIAAGEWAGKEAPNHQWHMHTVREGPTTDGSYHNRTRVYAMSVDASGPDLEFLFSDVKNKETPLLIAKTLVHEAGAWKSEEIQMALPGPTAVTIARALERGELAKQIIAIGSDSSRWGIDSEKGEFELLEAGEAPEGEDAEGDDNAVGAEVDASVDASVDLSVGD